MSEVTVAAQWQSESIVKRSRFIAILSPCSHLETAKKLLDQLANEHPQATHIVYAFRVLTPEGLRERSSDAGEPAGTAGRPILHQLQGKRVVNACLAVVRYFGGIKLGAGGLVRAYSQAARQVLESAVLKPYIAYDRLEIEIAYPRVRLLKRLENELGVKVVAMEYGALVRAKIEVPAPHVETVKRVLRLNES